jgi:hypothetical protein
MFDWVLFLKHESLMGPVRPVDSLLSHCGQIPKRLLVAVVWGCVGDAPALLPLLGEDFTATAEVREGKR